MSDPIVEWQWVSQVHSPYQFSTLVGVMVFNTIPLLIERENRSFSSSSVLPLSVCCKMTFTPQGLCRACRRVSGPATGPVIFMQGPTWGSHQMEVEDWLSTWGMNTLEAAIVGADMAVAIYACGLPLRVPEASTLSEAEDLAISLACTVRDKQLAHHFPLLQDHHG